MYLFIRVYPSMRDWVLLERIGSGDCGNWSLQSVGLAGGLEAQAGADYAVEFLRPCRKAQFLLLRPSADCMKPTHVTKGKLYLERTDC